MEDLSNITRALRLPSDRSASVAMQWEQMEAGEEEDVQERPGDKHSGKIYKRCESAGVVFAEWPVIGVGGKVSSPNAPAGVGGSKSK